MSYMLTMSPDFNTKYISGWFVFNTWLQKNLGESIHLNMYDDFESCRKAIMAGEVDLIYANPYDASLLLREKGFLPVAHAHSRPDEAVITVNANSSVTKIEDFKKGVRISSTDDPEVNMICQIMLEPADLTPDDMVFTRRENYVLVAKDLIKQEADAGFILYETFHDLSPMICDQLRVILKSQIHVIHHMLLVGPKLAPRIDDLRKLMAEMDKSEKGAAILKDIGVSNWELSSQEDAEFMIDLMDTLIV